MTQRALLTERTVHPPVTFVSSLFSTKLTQSDLHHSCWIYMWRSGTCHVQYV